MNREINNTQINIGTGKEISIKKPAQLVKEHIGFDNNNISRLYEWYTKTY